MQQRRAVRLASIQKGLETRRRNAATRLEREAARKAAEESRKAAMKAEEEFFAKLILDSNSDDSIPLSEQENEDVNTILSRFFNSCAGYTINKIERVYNSHLEEKYDATLKRLREKGRPTDEVFMFHGTAHANISKLSFPLHLAYSWLGLWYKASRSEESMDIQSLMAQQWYLTRLESVLTTLRAKESIPANTLHHPSDTIPFNKATWTARS